MAKIYDKAITLPSVGFDRVLILDPREALIYASPYDDWNQIRIGFTLSATTASSDNGDLDRGQNVSEVATFTSVNDKYYLGMKMNTPYMPTQNNEPFLGVCPTGSYAGARSGYNGIAAYNFSIEDSNMGSASAGVLHSNQSIDAVTLGQPLYLPAPAYMMGTEQICMFHGFLFTVINKNQANQQINIKYATTAAAVNGMGESKQSDAQFRTQMTNSSYTNLGDFDWHLSGSPYRLPNALFAYFPWANTRLRIHQVGIIKEQ